MRSIKILAVSLGLTVGAATAQAAPTLWVDDSSGIVGRVDVPTGNVTIVGNSGAPLTDIAFDPSGNLFGISFTNLYRINTTTGAATLIGPTGIPGGNALVFGTNGTLFAAGNTTTNLFSVNPSTGAGTVLGNDGFFSSGDLAF